MDQLNIQVSLECFVKKDGKYLMLHRKEDKPIMPNVWMAPGGRREFNEGLFEAARREIKEETNLEIKNLKVLCTGNVFLGDLNIELYFHLLAADYASGELPQVPEDGQLVWMAMDDILKLDSLLAELKQILPIVLGENPKFISYKAVYEAGNNLKELKIEQP